MDCVKCGSNKIKVLDTYKQSDTIYRKRKCTMCDCTFDTVETVASGKVPHRWTKIAKNTKEKEVTEVSKPKKKRGPFRHKCVVCESKKYFCTGQDLIVCTNKRCSAFYVPVPRALNRAATIKYLNERR